MLSGKEMEDVIRMKTVIGDEPWDRYRALLQVQEQATLKEMAKWLEAHVVGCTNSMYTLAIKTHDVAKLHQGEMPKEI